MSDNPLDRIPIHDRISLRAVMVPDGEDPGPSLAAAGIVDPVTLPVVFGEGQPDISFGDGFTPNVSAVLEPAQRGDDRESKQGGQRPKAGGYDPAQDPDHAGSTPHAGDSRAAVPPPEPSPTNLPTAFGLQPLAPVRRRISAR